MIHTLAMPATYAHTLPPNLLSIALEQITRPVWISPASLPCQTKDSRKQANEVARQKMLAALRQMGRTAFADLAEQQGCTIFRVRNLMAAPLEAGLVRRVMVGDRVCLEAADGAVA